ncbi:hypothetical protein [Oceanobacillus caeni]|nr:hypothetical protein [Oceanobacillus caeni]
MEWGIGTVAMAIRKENGDKLHIVVAAFNQFFTPKLELITLP